MLQPLGYPLAFFRLSIGDWLGLRFIFGGLDIVLVVEVTEHVKEKTGVDAEESVDTLWVVAVPEHNREVVIEDNAELDQLKGRYMSLPPKELVVLRSKS